MPTSTKLKRRRTAPDDRHDNMLEVLRLFRVIFKSVRTHYDRVRRQTGVNGAQLWALSYIEQTPGCTPGDLARSMALHQSTASNLVRGLVELGLVTRARDREDQRVVSLQPTAKGRRVMKRAPTPLIGILQDSLSRLPEKDLRALKGLLRRLTQSMPPEAASEPISTM